MNNDYPRMKCQTPQAGVWAKMNVDLIKVFFLIYYIILFIAFNFYYIYFLFLSVFLFFGQAD